MSRLALSGVKLALLEKRLQEERLARTAMEPIPRCSYPGPAPLSFAQQRMWFLQQLDAGSHLYNIPLAIRIEGALNIPALNHAINQIIARHESLRTVFRVVDSAPFQVVNPAFSVELSPVHVLSQNAKVHEEEIAGHIGTEARHVFDLAAGPLIRAKLLGINESEHILLLCMHHIVADGWSVGILLRELGALYKCYHDGRQPLLPELSIQYLDFAIWQHGAEQQSAQADQLAYWKDKLAGIPPVLDLPADHPRYERKSSRGSAVSFSISKEISEKLAALGQVEGATLFMTLLAAFSVLLYRYSGQEDFAIGTPVAGRNRPEVEDLIGLFVNTLVLRAQVSGDATFRELLRQTKEACLGAYARPDVPFEKLVEELHPERSLVRSPLFQVMLDLQSVPLGPLNLEPLNLTGLHLTLLPVEPGTSKFDLTLTLHQTGRGLEGALEYSSDLFEPLTARRITESFSTLLGGITSQPDAKVSELPLLSEGEKATLLTEWNRGAREHGAFPHVHRSFEQQVRKAPNHLAVACAHESLTYSELNRQANQLARYLQARGLGPEMFVGICLERSVNVVMAILATLKAGCAYVPLDPEYPREHLVGMVKDSDPRVVLTESRFLQKLPVAPEKIICLDLEREQIKEQATDDLDHDVLADNPAYVIYTSGSSGRPKGAVVSHSNLAYSTHARILYYGEPITAFLWLSSFSFDSSVAGLFWTLCQRGKLVIPEEGSHHDPALLANLIEQHSVSHLLCLPALYELVLDRGYKKIGSVRTAIVAGETCPAALIQRHRQRLPQTQLFNEYGPTEATVWSSVFDCKETAGGGSVPIGRPLLHTRIYLLDRHLRLAPIGALGEICISGAGLARGYLNNPALTADRFIPDPFSGVPGSRLYRTGDLARYGPSGHIDFRGRNDLQIKLRGHRIELEEIEQALGLHPAVQQAAVVSDGSSLTAYVTLRAQHTTAKDLRRHLEDLLPNYMLPQGFVILESLALTPAGKLDRKALALCEPKAFESPAPFPKPATALEEMLAEIFAAVLGLECIGIHDNFFETGGHSLLATQVLSRIYDALQVELPLRRIFEEPTVAGLAQNMVADPSEKRRIERTAELLLHLSGVTDEQAAALLEGTTDVAGKEHGA